ncbi:hypothetical protein CDD81_7579 [Ophiocordyceps australis]|uniref:U3 small nucleolar ribonucleoprotein protein MPP10 n=1 Tax=Ophiocordyceps australis TaxID=1399860 RepID=A0A2C5Y334_9HYPO|nr:hypothetical protein CDD81_7579 [Ophiocordyceps australis]
MAATVAAPRETSTLLESLQPENRHVFLQPSSAIPNSSLQLVKEALEGFAAQAGQLAEQLLKERRKRKRTDKQQDEIELIKLRKVYIEGFETGQVWQQANKIISGVLNVSERVFDELVEKGEIVHGSGETDLQDESDEDLMHVQPEDGQEDEDEDEVEDETEFDGLDDDSQDGEPYGQEKQDKEEEDGDESGQDKENEEDSDEQSEEEVQEFIQDPHGLNDGFFSIDDFNRETQLLEKLDSKGNATTHEDSDEEDVDWSADPLAPSRKQGKATKSSIDQSSSLSDESDDDDGPTFGDMPLDAPEGESEDEAMLDETGSDPDQEGENANEIYYKDFFAQPRRKRNDNAKTKAKGKQVSFQAEPTQQDMERAMADVRRDLFDDDSDMQDSDDALSDVSAGDPKSRRSTHERRQAKLRDEIRRLEAASVAKREWTLMGEAAATDRPINSLLEEDLDFEHAGKPVAVITPAVSEDIEQLIKRRILARDFDEVRRRRPDAESAPPRRGLVDVADTKPTRGLADEYEEEHLARTDAAHANKDGEKLAREEREVQALWTSVCARLDALSSWHYRPKPAAPSLSVVADVAAVSMEDAQPAVASALTAQSSRLAPQEVYRAADDKAPEGEVLTRAGAPLARAEMSQQQRTRRRRRAKERARKAGSDNFGAAQHEQQQRGKAATQRDTVAALKRGGVKVINRRGEVTDVEGNKTGQAKSLTSGSLKL